MGRPYSEGDSCKHRVGARTDMFARFMQGDSAKSGRVTVDGWLGLKASTPRHKATFWLSPGVHAQERCVLGQT